MLTAGRSKLGVRFSLMLAAVILAAATLSACDSNDSGNSRQDGNSPRTVTVVGSGEVQGVPDTLTVDVVIEFIASDVTAAMNQTNERQQSVINALTDTGIDSKDISTTDVSLRPEYGGTGTIEGYRADNSIRVKVRQPDSASEVLATIVNTGGDATRINSVRYAIEDDSQLVKDARASAFQDAKDRAEQYAQLAGLTLGNVISISEAPGGAPPIPMPMPRAMASNVPLEPGQQTVSFTVTVVWALT